MHHFRGKLFQGDKVCLDPANVYIDYQSTEVDLTTKWSGYLLVGSEMMCSGDIYTLKLVTAHQKFSCIDKFAPDDSEQV